MITIWLNISLNIQTLAAWKHIFVMWTKVFVYIWGIKKQKKQHYASVHASGKDSRWPIYAVGNAALITCIRFWFFGNAIELPPFRTRQWVNNLSLISMWIISDSDLLGFSFILQITMKSAMSYIPRLFPIFHAMADNLFIYKIIYTFELGFHTQQCGNIM